jgi:predicted small metal-binding protein
MKKVSCPCGAEFKTHTEDELVEIINVHARRAHPNDYPKGVAREEARKMMREA